MRLTLPLLLLAAIASCTSWSSRLYSDPVRYRVVNDTLTIFDADADTSLAILHHGDTLVVVGERSASWDYELSMHTTLFVVTHAGRRALVPFRELVTVDQYQRLFGEQGQLPMEQSASVAGAHDSSATSRLPGLHPARSKRH